MIHYKEEQQHPQLQSCSPLLFTKEQVRTQDESRQTGEFGMRNSHIILSLPICLQSCVLTYPDNKMRADQLRNALLNKFCHSPSAQRLGNKNLEQRTVIANHSVATLVVEQRWGLLHASWWNARTNGTQEFELWMAPPQRRHA